MRASLRHLLDARERTHERGAVLTWVIIVIVVVLVVLLAVSAASLQSLTEAKSTVARTVGMAAADSGIQVIQSGLQSRTITEADDYAPTVAQLDTLVHSSTTDAVPNTDPRIPTSSTEGNLKLVDHVYWFNPNTNQLQTGPSVTPATVIDHTDPNNQRMWQVYRVQLPNWYSLRSNNLVVFIRAWVSNASGKVVTKPRIIRTEYRPGYFADYQLVSDGPIHFEGGAHINGPVHTNGYRDDILAVPPSPSVRIWANGSPVCAGTKVIMTTAQGTINGSIPGACHPQAANNKFVDIGNVNASFDQLEGDAIKFGPSGPVRHFPAIAGSYDVQLASNPPRAIVNGSTVLSLATKRAALFDDDVRVHGSSTNRFTIAARRPTAVGGAADITLTDDVDGGHGLGDSLGLVAQGNIVIDTNSCAVHNIHAAMIAETGSLTIPPTWTTDMYQDNPPHCGGITVDGSVAGHRTPVLRWTWNDGTWAGYGVRNYSYDSNFRTNTPPYFPVSDAWQVADWRDANGDCLAGTRNHDEDCM